MIIRYTADLHLFDPGTVKWRYNADHFHEDMLCDWNRTVSDDDIIFIIGDLGRDIPETHEIIKQLKGIKILVIGNHDLNWNWTLEKYQLFQGVHNCILSNGVLMIHNPTDAQNIEYKWLIHGHLHTYEAQQLARYHKTYITNKHLLNCAMDMTCTHPCTFQELLYYKSLYLEDHPI